MSTAVCLVRRLDDHSPLPPMPLEDSVDSALKRAIQNHDVNSAREFLTSHSFSLADDLIYNRLYDVIDKGNAIMMRLFLKYVPITKDERGDLVCDAVNLGRSDIVDELLLSGPISIETRSNAVLNSASLGFHNEMRALLRYGYIFEEEREQAFAIAAREGDFIIFSELFLAFRGSFSPDCLGTALCSVATIGHEAMLNVLLRHSRIPPEYRTEAILHASREGHQAVVNILKR